MMKKIIVALIVVVAVLGIAFAAFENSNKKAVDNNNPTIQNQQQTISNNNTTINKTNQSIISAAEAKKIAKSYIKVSGVTAGTPTLVNQVNKQVYIVPLTSNGTNVGEIDIDAITGANLGGAGGSP